MKIPTLIPLAFLATSALFATDGTYTANTSSAWNTASNWQNSIVASGVGATATISHAAWNASRTVTQNTDMTLGSVVFTATNANYNSSVTGSGLITLDNNGSASLIENKSWGAASFYSKIALNNDLNLKNTPTTNTGSAGNFFMGFNGEITNTHSTTYTITTLKSDITPSNTSYFRIVLAGGVTGNIAIRHNSGNYLNLQTTANSFTGGLYIKSGIVNSNGLGVSALGDSNNTITFETRDSVSDAVGVLTFSGLVSNSSLLVGTQNIVLQSDGRIGIGLVTTTSTQTGGITTVTWNGHISGAGALYKQGTGSFVLGAQNTYTGDTVIEAGTLISGTNSAVNSASDLRFASGNTATASTFSANGFSNTFGTLSLQGAGVIDLGSTGTNVLIFADSSEIAWGAYTLSIVGTFIDGESVRIGTDGNGLTADQLAKITINGETAYLTNTGYLTTTIPEPAVAALLTGVLALALAIRRRRT